MNFYINFSNEFFTIPIVEKNKFTSCDSHKFPSKNLLNIEIEIQVLDHFSGDVLDDQFIHVIDYRKLVIVSPAKLFSISKQKVLERKGFVDGKVLTIVEGNELPILTVSNKFGKHL